MSTDRLMWPDLAEVTSRLGRLLHRAAVPVTTERAGRLAAALAAHPPGDLGELYWMARVTLVSAQSQIETFDRVFAHLFSGMLDPAQWRGQDKPLPPAHLEPGRGRSSPPPDRSAPTVEVPSPPASLGDTEVSDGEAEDGVTVTQSAEERLRTRDFASLSEDELGALRLLTARMAFAPPPRRARRRVRAPRGRDLDVRATLRRARRSGGEPVVAIRRRPRSRPRRLVLICDISGSMEPYARAYLQLLRSGAAGARAEVFVFATALTRLTRDLGGVSPSAALDRAVRRAPDWSGGTRIGDALKRFNDDHGRRGVARGAIVVILSDGWDRGDPDVVAEEMSRLGRLAHRVIWVNPRKASPAYQPLTGGMVAALPHVDRLVSGHSLTAFDEVLAAISQAR